MDTLNNLEKRLNDILSEYSDVTVLGTKQLDEFVTRIDEIKKEAYDVSTDVLTSLTRDENGRFIGKNNIEYDIGELAVITKAVDELTDRVYNEIHRLAVERENKREMISQRYHSRRELNNNNRLYKNQVERLRLDITECDRMLDIYKNDEVMKTIYERKKKANEEGVDIFNDIIEKNDAEIEKINNEINIIMNGGALPLEIVLEDEQDLNDNKDKVEKRNNTKDDDFKDGFKPVGDGDFNYTSDEEQNLNNKKRNNTRDDDFKDGFKPVGDGDFNYTDEEEKQKTTVVPVITPGFGEDEELENLPEEPIDGEDEELESLPGEPVDGEDEELENLPEEPIDGEDEELEDLPEEPIDGEEEEKEDEVVPVIVEETSQPKPTLFQKIKNIIYKAILVLGGLSATTLTIDHFLNHHDAATFEENPNLEEENPNLEDEGNQEKEDEQEQNPSKQESPEAPSVTPSPSQGTTPSPEPGPTSGSTPTPSPAPTPEPEPTPSPTPTPDKPEDVIHHDNTPFPIELGEGETVYNEESGVEVTQDGSAVLYNENGGAISQEDRDLDQTDHGTSVVVEEDLYPDLNTPSMTFEEQVAAVPAPEATNEMTVDEAIASGELTEGEQQNLDDAFQALEDFFNEEYTMVP